MTIQEQLLARRGDLITEIAKVDAALAEFAAPAGAPAVAPPGTVEEAPPTEELKPRRRAK